MLRYLLDTNIVIYVIKNKPVSALDLFNKHAGHMAISAITLAELLHGAEKSNAPERSLSVVEDFCTGLDVLPYGPKAAQHYGSIRSALKKTGTNHRRKRPAYCRPCPQRRANACNQQPARIRTR